MFQIHELSKSGRLNMNVKISLLFHIIEIFDAEGWSSEAVSFWSDEKLGPTKLKTVKRKNSHILGINIHYMKHRQNISYTAQYT